MTKAQIDASGLLILPRLQVQNANAISGPLTWGFRPRPPLPDSLMRWNGVCWLEALTILASCGKASAGWGSFAIISSRRSANPPGDAPAFLT